MSKDTVFKRFHERVNMSPGELESWRDSDNREVYAERKSGGQSLDEPLDDVLRLLDTPKSEWQDKDDGFNEIEEANEVLSFTGRMGKVDPGEDMPNTDPGISKQEASMINWGVDSNPGKSDFTGDRQR